MSDPNPTVESVSNKVSPAVGKWAKLMSIRNFVVRLNTVRNWAKLLFVLAIVLFGWSFFLLQDRQPPDVTHPAKGVDTIGGALRLSSVRPDLMP